MDDVWTRRADNARVAYEARARALEAREDKLKKALRDVDEAHAVIRGSMQTLSWAAGEALSAGSAPFVGMYEELSALASGAERELDASADHARNELRSVYRGMEEERERYLKTVRALDEEAQHR